MKILFSLCLICFGFFLSFAQATTPTPWEEGFETTAIPTGWTRNSFVINTTLRLPGAQTNVIYRNFISGNPNITDYFSTISVGEINNGDALSFKYRFANFASPYDPPAAGAGKFVVAVSTDYGSNYQAVQTVLSDGNPGWLDYQLDLSSFEGEFVKIKITGTWISGSWVLGFDDFHIGPPVLCEKPYNLTLDFVGSEDAQISWENESSAESYNWFLFSSGADPETDSPVLTGNSENLYTHLGNLNSNTAYNFYVQSDCGGESGVSPLSESLSFTTLCPAVTIFPFEENFEDDSPSLDCWMSETLSGNIEWGVSQGAFGGSVNAAHNGSRNALYFYDSPAQTKSRLISPPFDLTALDGANLSFWYANQAWNGQNELRIYYKSSSAGEWVLIPGAVYTSDVDEWTQVEIQLPEPGEEYYLAFEGKNNWGYGIVLDDISIYESADCPDSTTWNGISWSNGEPDAQTKAIIDGDLSTTQDYESCSLEITENGSLYIGEGNNFTVHHSIHNYNTSSSVTVANDANLIQIEEAANSGEITVLRNSKPIKRLDYTLWSSPVENQQIQSFSPQTLPNRIYTYEGENGYVAVPNVSSDFEPAKGYLFRAPNNWNPESPVSYPGIFIGTPNNGNIVMPAYAGSYTSAGNPYPSNIDADLLLDANSGISSLYFWTNTNPVVDGEYSGNNYAVYTYAGGVGTIGPEGNESEVPNGIISVGQGFIAATTNESISFDNSMRTTDDSEFIRNTLLERHRYWLNFTFHSTSISTLNQIMIGYMEGATNGYDNQIDALIFGYSGSALYSRIDGSENKYVIQGRALPFDVYDVVHLGVYIENAGNYQISIAGFDGLFSEGQQIYILDKYLHQVHNLTDSLYEFYSETGEFNDRFDIVYIENSSDCTETTIWDGYTWNNGLPDENKKAVINGAFNLDHDLEVCEFEVAPNGKFTLTANANLTVNGILINNSNLVEKGFIVENNANLLQSPAYTGTNLGPVKVLRESREMIRLDYTMWSSPVMAQNLFNFSPETVNGVTNYPGSTGRIYVYNGESGYENPSPFDSETVFGNGVGYLFRAPNNWPSATPQIYPGVFTGEPFNGNLTVPVFSGNYTSVGNPYPSNLDAGTFLQENPGVGAIYFWINTELSDGEYIGNNYATYNISGGTSNTGITMPGGAGVPTGIISVGQGFLISSENPSVHFSNEMRTSGPADFLRTDELEKHRFWLNLSDGDNNGLNQILIGYIENATNGFDLQMDAVQFGYEGSAIYSLLGSEELTIQGKQLPFESADVVPLGFHATVPGKYKISLASYDGLFAEGQSIYLKDKSSGVIHKLNDSPYEFNSEAGVFDERFEIVYEKENLGLDENPLAEVQVYKNGENIEILSKQSEIYEIKVFDLSGRLLLYTENINQNFYRLNSRPWDKQVVIIRVKTADGKISGKKLIN